MTGFKFFYNRVCFFEVGIINKSKDEVQYTPITIKADEQIIGAKYLVNELEGDVFITDFQLMVTKR